MNILSIPYITGGLSHLVPFYVMHQKYIKNNLNIKNYFLVNESLHSFFKNYNIEYVPIDYTINQTFINDEQIEKINNHVAQKEKEAFNLINPSLIIEDNSFLTPLIAEKNNIPRISIQRTGAFRSLSDSLRNINHTHSLQKGSFTQKADFIQNGIDSPIFSNIENQYLNNYLNSKAKIIPGIATIERLPESIEDRESYFYCGPLLIMDKPSKNLSIRLGEFLNNNRQKKVVFITTGTVDKTPIENFIEFFVKRNYAVITTCDCKIDKKYEQQVCYNKFLPLNHICGISDLVIHQCGSGIYHYPIINRVPSFTIGTLCYDREDVAQRLQELRVSGHIPHPEDNSNYWNIFLELVKSFESNTLIDFNMLDRLKIEIDETSSNFKIEHVIQYALR